MNIDQLASEKREKLIQALIKEYGTQGYKNASTNVIVKEAEISKGSLFNYIGNKEKQYFFIVEYCLDLFKNKLHEYMQVKEVPKDFFEQLLYRSNMKIRLSLEYPLEYKLMFDAYLEEAPEIKAFMAKQYVKFSEISMTTGKENLDPEVLKNPLERDKVVELVYHMIAGYSVNYLNNHKILTEEEIAGVLEHMTSELSGYFDLLRKHFFKEQDEFN